MSKSPNSKLFCVGDDWQSIMGFTGSNLEYFVNFGKYFKKPARTDLRVNYRSIKSIVDAGADIIKNNGDIQLNKETIANDKREHKIIVYSSPRKKEYQYNYYNQTAKHCIEKISELLSKNDVKTNDIMILTRILKNPKFMNILEEEAMKKNIPIKKNSKSPDCIPILSVHGSKGLESKIVILLNVDKGLYGFPCELENPDIFEPAMSIGRKRDKLEEERRLFYVAVTRAKEDLFIYCQKYSKSDFIKEIEDHIEYNFLPFEY